jgi:maleate isomerase
MSLQTALAEKPAEWHTLPCDFDDALAGRAAIGLLALASDGVIESELRKFLPADGVAVYTTRLPRIPDTTPPSLRLMEQGIAECTGRLLPGRKLDVLAFGCTSAAMVIGPEAVTASIHTVREDIAVTDPVSASLKAFATLGMRRVAVLTPYIDSVNAEVASYLTRNGLAIVDCASFKQASGTINRITESDVYRAGVHLALSDPEAVFISCTGLRCSSVIDQLERDIGKPVVASNQALAWDVLRLAGVREQVRGFGRLLTM